MHPVSISFFRMFFGFLTLVPIYFFTDNRALEPRKKDVWHFAGVGFLFAAAISTYHLALSHTTVANASLMSSLDVFFIIPLAYLFLKEKIHTAQIPPLIIAGVAIFLLNPFTLDGWLGSIIAAGSGFIYAGFLVAVRYEERRNMAGDMMWYLFFAAVFLSPSLFLLTPGGITDVLPLLLVLGVFCTGVSYYLIDNALENTETEMVGLALFISTPIVSITTAYFFLHEAITLPVAAGAVLLIASGILVKMASKS
ncbi:MAG: DMT family transporter [Patescibacteria group bacterium]